MAKIALLIGMSHYQYGLAPLPAAVKDVEELQRVLVNPEIGYFDQVKTLVNSDSQEMQNEIENLFTERNKDDLVLLFFSGHGIKDENSNLYFGTCNTQKYPQGELRRSTAVPASFVHDVMSNSRAKRQVIILDCCFSGAFDPSLQAKDDGSIDLEKQLGAEGRVVLTSSSSTQYSFEQKDSELSLYTRYLVEGIETGEGDKNRDGKISILELHDYVTRKVQEEIPNTTPKIIVVRDKGFDIILSRVIKKTGTEKEETKRKIDFGEIQLDGTQERIDENEYYSPVPSILQPCEPLIKRLIATIESEYLLKINSDTGDSDLDKELANGNIVLDSVRLALDSTFVFVARFLPERKCWTIQQQSSFCEEFEINENEYAKIIRTDILSSLSRESIFNRDGFGIYRSYQNEKLKIYGNFLVFPIDFAQKTEFMVICDLKNDSIFFSNACTKVVASFYKASQEFGFQISKIEAAILDNLRRRYGFLPLSLYNRRFDLFCDRLSRIIVHFEPILDLDTVSISGWEALARDPENDNLTAPTDLFNAAELWGRKFTIELDVHLLKIAARSYRQALIEAKQNRPHEILPLSVNVYPESLMHPVYFNTVREVTQEGRDNLIPARKLILEISEKTDLPTYLNGIRLHSPLDTFKEKLSEYSRSLKIKFAIDDFGVGYASVSRLSGLNVPYVKIDREILYHQPVNAIIHFVHEIAYINNPLNPASVIIEGLDESSPLNLRNLKNLGVSYVQGYIVGKAGANIYRLSLEKYKFLEKSLKGEI